LEKLRQVYSRALANWEMLLTQPVKDEEAFKKAFRATLTRHPEVIECARSGGLLATIMRAEFPTLAKDAPEALEGLTMDVVAGFLKATQAEFDDFVREAGLEAKLADLERREAHLKASRAEAASERPLPLLDSHSPEEEMRSVAVEAMLSHEAQLQAELERVRCWAGGSISFFVGVAV
jgi:hypothetical protein